MYKPPTRLWPLLLNHPGEVFNRFNKGILEGEIFDRAAQLAFWFMLAVFPGLLSVFVIFGFVVEERVGLRTDLFRYLDSMIPTAATAELVHATIDEVSENRGGGKFSFGILVTLWIGSTVLSQIHRIIDRLFKSDRRQTWFRRLAAFPFSVVVLLPLVLASLLLFYGELIGVTLAHSFDLTDAFIVSWNVVRWPIILLSAILCFDAVYNSAPSMLQRSRGWCSPGATLALILWLVVSHGFRRYVEMFPNYSTIYGSLGVVIVLLLWFFLTALAVLAGVHFNTTLHQLLEEKRGTEERPIEGLA